MAEDTVFALVPAVGRDHLAAIACPAKNADNPVGHFVEAADDFGFDLPGIAADQPGERSLAGPELVAGSADQAENRRPAACRPTHRPGQRHTVGIAAESLHWHHLG